MSESPETSLYDLTPFTSYPSPERTPERLWWIATLRGLTPKVPSRARVLEIGCATGVHLLALAERSPEGEYLGVDLSAQQIRTAQELQKKASSQLNIRFLASSFTTLSPEEGPFDYIICHGVYSWIAEEDRAALLRQISRLLAENGVCYLSHNTLPGWGVRDSLCRFLRSHDDRQRSPVERVERARALLAGMDERLVDAHRPYGMQLQEEVRRNLHRSDAFFLHELLAEHASAQWLGEVVGAADEVSLAYLGDAHPQRLHAFDGDRDRYSTGSVEELFQQEGGEEKVAVAQFYDLLYPSSFRGSLFVRDGAELSPDFRPEMIEKGYLASPLVCEEEASASREDLTILPFYGPSEQVVEQRSPIMKQLLFRLSQCWPAPRSFPELLADIGGSEQLARGERETVVQELLALFHRNLLDVYPEDQHIASRLEERPKILPFRRHRLSEEWTITLRNELFRGDPLDQKLIPLLDGTRTPAECVTEIESAVRSDALQFRVEDEVIAKDNPEWSEYIKTAVYEKCELYLEQALFSRAEITHG